MNSFLETIRRLGTARLIAMGGVAAALLIAFGVLATRLSAPSMGLLFGELTIEDSSHIVEKLEAMKVPYELKANGTQIYVPRAQALRLRMTMASAGLPTGGATGYELFDNGDSLGTTDFVQKINRLRALEGELARTIRSIDGIAAVRVHLVLPRRELFVREKREPSASIVLRVRGRGLEPSQVDAIQHLVAAAVPDLKPGRVSIVDDNGRLLSRAEDESGRGNASLIEFRLAHEKRLKAAIESLVQQSVGIGNVRAEVSAVVDFDRFTENSERFDPDGQVVRSTQLVEEASSANESEADNTVTVANNLPEAAAAEDGGGGSKSHSTRTEETTNYEISKTVRTQVHETGTVKRVSVAVLVDGTYTTDEKGKEVYQPRSPEQLEKIAALVKSAIGYNEARGDQVEVVNMRFARLADELPAEPEPTGFSLTTADYMRLAEIGAFLVVGLVIAFVLLRPLMKSLLRPAPASGEAPAQLPPPAPRAIDRPEILQAIEAGDITQEEAEQLMAAKPAAALPGTDPLIDIAMIEGRVKSSSLKKIGELIQKHPEEAVGIMRSWMYQDSRV